MTTPKKQPFSPQNSNDFRTGQAVKGTKGAGKNKGTKGQSKGRGAPPNKGEESENYRKGPNPILFQADLILRNASEMLCLKNGSVPTCILQIKESSSPTEIQRIPFGWCVKGNLKGNSLFFFLFGE